MFTLVSQTQLFGTLIHQHDPQYHLDHRHALSNATVPLHPSTPSSLLHAPHALRPSPTVTLKLPYNLAKQPRQVSNARRARRALTSTFVSVIKMFSFQYFDGRDTSVMPFMRTSFYVVPPAPFPIRLLPQTNFPHQFLLTPFPPLHPLITSPLPPSSLALPYFSHLLPTLRIGLSSFGIFLPHVVSNCCVVAETG